MRLLRYMVAVFCLCVMTVPCMGEEYEFQIKLQEFSTQGSASIDLGHIISNSTELKKLTPGKVHFAQRINVSENKTLNQKIQIDSSEVDIDCQLGEKEKDSIPVTLAISISKVFKVVDGVPLKNARSANTRVEFPIGEEILLSGCSVMKETLTGFTVKLAKKSDNLHRLIKSLHLTKKLALFDG